MFRPGVHEPDINTSPGKRVRRRDAYVTEIVTSLKGFERVLVLRVTRRPNRDNTFNPTSCRKVGI